MEKIEDSKIFEIRLAGIERTSSRARKVLLVSTVLTFTILSGFFNAYLSWVRDFANPMVNLDSLPPITREIDKQILKNWVDSLFVTVPGVAVKFSVTDISVWGAAGLTIAALWLFFNMRRENHLIAYALHEASKYDPETNIYKMVVAGIRASQVFATGSQDDRRFDSIKAVAEVEIAKKERREIQKKLADAREEYEGADNEEDKQQIKKKIVDLEQRQRKIPGGARIGALIARWALLFTLWLPGLGCVAILIFEIASISLFPAIFRGQAEPLGWEYMQRSDLRTMIAGCAVMACISMYFAWRTQRYQRGTRKLLEEAAESGV
jgi:hypothetical protein